MRRVISLWAKVDTMELLVCCEGSEGGPCGRDRCVAMVLGVSNGNYFGVQRTTECVGQRT